MDSKYLEALRKHILTKIAPLAIPDSSENVHAQRLRLVENGALNEWVRSMTHRSYDPNPAINLETREYSGDAILAAIIAISVTKKNANIGPEMLTDLKNSKLWKGEQARLSDRLELSSFLLTNIPITVDDKEDLFESMFGTLQYIGDRYFSAGTGFILCQNTFISLYGDLVIGMDKLSLKSPLNQLKEIGDKLKWFDTKSTIDQFGVPKRIDDANGRTIKYELIYKLTPKAIEWLHKQRKTIVNNGIIAHQSRHTKKDTILAAVQEALSNLKKYYGVDWKSADDFNRRLGPKSMNRALLDQMQSDGVVDIDINIVAYKVDEKDGAYYQLLGTTEQGTVKILLTIINDISDRIDIKRQITDYYEKNGSCSPSVHIRFED